MLFSFRNQNRVYGYVGSERRNNTTMLAWTEANIHYNRIDYVSRDKQTDTICYRKDWFFVFA